MAVWIPRTSAFNTSLGYVGCLAANTDGSVIVAYGSVDASVNNANTMYRSTDFGKTWQVVTTNVLTDSGFQRQPFRTPGICWSENLGLFVAIGCYGSGTGWRIASSPDGDVWTTRQQNAGAVTFINGSVQWQPSLTLFTAIGQTSVGLFCRTSPDGITWTTQATSANTLGQLGFAWSEDLALGVSSGFSATALSTTTDGIAFSAVAAPIDGSNALLTGGGNVVWSDRFSCFFAQGFDGSTGANVILKSTNGTLWTTVFVDTTFFGLSAVGIQYDGSVAVAGYDLDFQRAWWVTSDGGSTWVSSRIVPSIPNPPSALIGFNNVSANVNLFGVQPDATHLFAIFSRQQVLAPAGTGNPPTLWKYFIAELDGTGITEYSKLASARYVELSLNQPLKVGGSVPSDNSLVNLPIPSTLGTFTVDDSYLSEGIRLLWAFRKESTTSPYYTVRAATLIQMVEDAAEQDDATTSFVGYDPWQLLFSRVVRNSDGDVPGKDGLSFTNTSPLTIIGSLLQWTIDAEGHAYIDAGLSFGGTTFYTGNLEAGPGIDINFPRGTSVGEAWQMVCDMGICDIILSPIYDPRNRPNYLVELNVYNQAGETRDEQRFAWNQPGRSLVGLNRQIDGTVRANRLIYGAGYAGYRDALTDEDDIFSISKFGYYSVNQMFPAALSLSETTPLAQQQLLLRRAGRTTVRFTPAPERSPEPWVDYQLGDRVPVFASREKFRYPLDRDPLGVTTGYQRIYGWRADIADDALEAVTVFVSQEGQHA